MTMPDVAAADDARPLVVPAVLAAGALVPAHTEIVFRLDEEIASNRAVVGQSIPVSVIRDVVVDGVVLIPRGSAGHGVVTARTGKGAFGKSGKLDIELRSVDVAGTSVPVTGRYHAAGDGRTGATLGTILVGGVIAGAFVTGRHAVFAEGREFTAFTADAIRVRIPPARTIVPQRFAAVAPNAPVPFVTPERPTPVMTASATEMTGTGRYDTLVRFQRALSQAQPTRSGNVRQGWTISD
ncbi:hypothetical protein FSB78_07235 [Sphingomonas ginsenosidivorax]|uniref:Uncharacterized protein n=1 Tax=Sphingomonas ginsenosidivorax TaxID=862135 RepID=A0A5C6UDN0_9SPHN|nr:hypothetical protein [Sphingomonas ginsenosidivorax]TXC70754.1 hypothetical protein FSB78_07235 [Sphingomonas ginsenosidivorax]